MSLLFNMLSRFIIAFLPRLQSISAVILQPKKIKPVTASTFSPSICHEIMGLDAMILVFWCWVSSQFFHSPFLPLSRGSLVPSSSLSAIRVVSSTYLRLFIFLLVILILAYDSFSPAFLMMYSAYKLNKQSDNFPQFVGIHTVKGISVGNEADVFLECPCFLCDPMNFGNLISGFSTFSKSSLYICKFLVHVLLKPSLEDFEYDLASTWNECNCAVIWTLVLSEMQIKQQWNTTSHPLPLL